jgi:hypothetical protein
MYSNKEANERRIKNYMADQNHIVDVHDSFAVLAFIDFYPLSEISRMSLHYLELFWYKTALLSPEP